MSERTCSLVVLGWEIAVARSAHPDTEGSPVVITDRGRVHSASPELVRRGVRPAIPLREAEACAPTAMFVERDEELSLDAFEPIVSAVGEFTPGVEISAPGELSFRARRAARVSGGEEPLLEQMFASLPLPSPLVSDLFSSSGGEIGIGASVAPGCFTALLAARSAAARARRERGRRRAASGEGPPAEHLIVPDGSGRSFLAPFAVEVLTGAIDTPELIENLLLLGITTLGEFAALPPRAVAARFGQAGLEAHLLARGVDRRPLLLHRPSEALEVCCELDPPVGELDRLVFAIKALADRLDAELKRSAIRAEHLRLESTDLSGKKFTASWRNDRGSKSTAERARWHVGAWRPSAPLALLRLTPEGLGPERGQQLSFVGVGNGLDPDTEAKAERAIERIRATLGKEGVLAIAPRGGRLPSEQALLLVAGSTGSPPTERPPHKSARYPWPGRLPSPAPAMETGGKLAVSSEEVAYAAGPFRYHLRWWDPDRSDDREIWQLLLRDGTALLASTDRRVATRPGELPGSLRLEAVYD